MRRLGQGYGGARRKITPSIGTDTPSPPADTQPTAGGIGALFGRARLQSESFTVLLIGCLNHTPKDLAFRLHRLEQSR